MMSWTTRRIQFDFVLSPLTKLSPGRPREPLAIEFHNSSVPSIEVVRNIGPGPVSSVIIGMRTFCLWVLHPGSFLNTLRMHSKPSNFRSDNMNKRSRTRYLDLFCLCINSSIYSHRELWRFTLHLVGLINLKDLKADKSWLLRSWGFQEKGEGFCVRTLWKCWNLLVDEKLSDQLDTEKNK